MGIQDVPSHPRWQLQTAKSRFSEVFHRARAEGPQYVTRQGKEAVVIVRAEEFERRPGAPVSPRAWWHFLPSRPWLMWS